MTTLAPFPSIIHAVFRFISLAPAFKNGVRCVRRIFICGPQGKCAFKPSAEPLRVCILGDAGWLISISDNPPRVSHHNRERRHISRYDGARTKRSEEHTSELQSLRHLVCRLLLEKKKKKH